MMPATCERSLGVCSTAAKSRTVAGRLPLAAAAGGIEDARGAERDAEIHGCVRTRDRLLRSVEAPPVAAVVERGGRARRYAQVRNERSPRSSGRSCRRRSLNREKT